MNKKDILYIIPGFGESVRDEGYQKIADFAKSLGYSVVKVPIIWKRTTIIGWLKQFTEMVKKHGSNATVLGFSFGAYIAILASEEFKFRKILACSLSPYFADDIDTLPELAFKILKKRRMEAFRNYRFPINNTPAVFFVGDKDIPIVIKRVEKSEKLWRGKKKLIYIKDVGHVVEAEDYLKAIFKELKNSGPRN